LIAGGSESGKSTVAVNLLTRGWRLLADDFVLLSSDGSTALANQALMGLSARSAPHIPAMFRGAIERSRWFSIDDGSDLRFYEVEPELIFGANVWSTRVRLDGVVFLDGRRSESRVRTIDPERVAEFVDAPGLGFPALPKSVRVGVSPISHGSRAAERIESWFDAHASL
jgi:hypothetical protein